jgi:hypothetical protein
MAERLPPDEGSFTRRLLGGLAIALQKIRNPLEGVLIILGGRQCGPRFSLRCHPVDLPSKAIAQPFVTVKLLLDKREVGLSTNPVDNSVDKRSSRSHTLRSPALSYGLPKK